MKPAKHGRDHAPGGEDPVPFQLPYAWGTNNALGQAVTDDEELVFDEVHTNDNSTFAYVSTDTSGILILREGLYATFAAVRVISADIAVPRSTYATIQPLSSGPLGGLGSEAGQTHFSMGTGQNQSSVGEVTAASTISKSLLNHMVITPVFGFNFTTDPPRLALILQHLGTNYTLNAGLDSTLTVVRIGNVGGAAAPPP